MQMINRNMIPKLLLSNIIVRKTERPCSFCNLLHNLSVEILQPTPTFQGVVCLVMGPIFQEPYQGLSCTAEPCCQLCYTDIISKHSGFHGCSFCNHLKVPLITMRTRKTVSKHINTSFYRKLLFVYFYYRRCSFRESQKSKKQSPATIVAEPYSCQLCYLPTATQLKGYSSSELLVFIIRSLYLSAYGFSAMVTYRSRRYAEYPCLPFTSYSYGLIAMSAY